ncbi:unnamed protein product [Echinostoma caproni]|uniref:Peptidase A2 domain-containing protein n=1 Tax=Echinostoma caproni TaxID=27848 RepID=A0A183B8V1_9TREM|nr:unnamed protein product [Echinostoma caproni]
MRQLLGTRVLDDAILRQLSLKRLSLRIREVLSVLSNSSLDEMALAADKMFEANPASHHITACSNPTPTTPRYPQSKSKSLDYTNPQKSPASQLQPSTLLVPPTIWPQSQEMHPTMFVHLIEKPRSQTVMTVPVSGILPSRLLFTQDQSTGIRFLIDTGAELSVIPRAAHYRHLQPTTVTLQVANSSRIHTYGRRFITLDLGSRQQFRWTFTIADVHTAIVVVDL